MSDPADGTGGDRSRDLPAVDPLSSLDHRPYPLPRGPWVMRQTWLDLLFAHWPVPAERLVSVIPRGLALDTWEGQAWVSVVAVGMRGVRPRLLPALPGLSAFVQLNVRTYVTSGGRPGLWMFSLDASNRPSVGLARRVFGLPYYHAAVELRRSGGAAGETFACRSRRTDRRGGPAVFEARYRPVGPALRRGVDALDGWLAERYCLYALRSGALLRADVHHLPWPLQPAEADVAVNTLRYGAAPGVALDGQPALTHYARGVHVLLWPPRVLRTAA